MGSGFLTETSYIRFGIIMLLLLVLLSASLKCLNWTGNFQGKTSSKLGAHDSFGERNALTRISEKVLNSEDTENAGFYGLLTRQVTETAVTTKRRF